MKITFPHMGNTWVPLKGLLEYVGLEVIVPPLSSERTIRLGVQYGPKAACLPLILNIGNFIEAQELGADTFILPQSTGPCHLGVYTQLQQDIMANLGIPYADLILEPLDQGKWQYLVHLKKLSGRASWVQVIQGIKLAYQKAIYVDELEKLTQYLRPREYRRGTADQILTFALTTLDKAQKNFDLQEAYGLARQKLLHIPHDEQKQVLNIKLVGELFTLLDPLANLEIEKKLGYLGVQVTRSIYLSDWLNEHLGLGLLKRRGEKDYQDYTSFQGGYQGLVQVAPFSWRSENVSEDKGIPVLTVWLDDQAGQEDLNTRLETFINLLQEKNHRKKVKSK